MPCTASTPQKINAPAASAVIQYAKYDCKNPDDPAAASSGGQVSPVHTLSAATVRPSAVANAAALARNSVRDRSGKGASTRTSRRLGKVESQLSTANSPTTSMVVAISICSVCHE